MFPISYYYLRANLASSFLSLFNIYHQQIANSIGLSISLVSVLKTHSQFTDRSYLISIDTHDGQQDIFKFWAKISQDILKYQQYALSLFQISESQIHVSDR